MKFFGTIADITGLNKELPTLMGFIPSETVNVCNRTEKLMAIKKPTVTCRLNLSMNFSLPTHPSRQSTSRSQGILNSNSRENYNQEVIGD